MDFFIWLLLYFIIFIFQSTFVKCISYLVDNMSRIIDVVLSFLLIYLVIYMLGSPGYHSNAVSQLPYGNTLRPSVPGSGGGGPSGGAGGNHVIMNVGKVRQCTTKFLKEFSNIFSFCMYE